jgi:hypothetical protein
MHRWTDNINCAQTIYMLGRGGGEGGRERDALIDPESVRERERERDYKRIE